MRIDRKTGEIVLDAWDCGRLTDAAAIVEYVGKHDSRKGCEVFYETATFLRTIVDARGKPKPTPEPPDKGKQTKSKEGATPS